MIVSINGILLDRIEQQLQWTDELWSPVGQQRRYSLSGIVHTTENVRYGRPITLSAELPWCVLNHSTVESLSHTASTPGVQFQLVFDDGRSFTVLFRRDVNPLDLTPIDPRKEFYSGTINLMEV